MPLGAADDQTPPDFVDLVKRSTRFLTSVPAAEVLCAIDDIVSNQLVPVPAPFDGQETSLAWDDYRLDVTWGGALAYSVHVFLVRGPRGQPQYMVEFRRGHVDIFLFKRYYEAVEERLAERLKETRAVNRLY
jgi:hypothetical protein